MDELKEFPEHGEIALELLTPYSSFNKRKADLAPGDLTPAKFLKAFQSELSYFFGCKITLPDCAKDVSFLDIYTEETVEWRKSKSNGNLFPVKGSYRADIHSRGNFKASSCTCVGNGNNRGAARSIWSRHV